MTVVQVKTVERVKEFGEVFTDLREVTSMLNLIPDVFPVTLATPADLEVLDARILEPSCGDGAFLGPILERKLAPLVGSGPDLDPETRDFYAMRALASVYGVDIQRDNVEESQARLRTIMQDVCGGNSDNFFASVDEVLATNLIVGNTLADEWKLTFVEYEATEDWSFLRTQVQPFNPTVSDMFSDLKLDYVPIFFYDLHRFSFAVEGQ